MDFGLEHIGKIIGVAAVALVVVGCCLGAAGYALIRALFN